MSSDEKTDKDGSGSTTGCVIIAVIAAVVLYAMGGNQRTNESEQSDLRATPQPTLNVNGSADWDDDRDPFREDQEAWDYFYGPTLDALRDEDIRLQDEDLDEEIQMLQAQETIDAQDWVSSDRCDGLVRGNVAFGTRERIYHVPGCPNYDDIVMNAAYGDRCFTSEAEAIAAGWRKARNCP
jgi:hypothetical protein